MSKLSAEERRKLPAEDFAGPGRTFPIVDQSDVHDAASLIGKASNPDAVKRKIVAIARRKGFDIPDSWKEKGDAKMSDGEAGSGIASIEFAADPSRRRVEGDFAVYPEATVFVCGEYKDKDFSLTPEEAYVAVDNFKPVGGNIEHTAFLAGKAAELRSVRLDPDNPFVVKGEVAIPLALDGLLGERERKLSAEWDRKTKTLRGLALTANPRVPEAVLMAAFSAATAGATLTLDDLAGIDEGRALAAFGRAMKKTPHGQRHMQDIHDMTAHRGAVCCSDGDDPGDDAMFMSSKERSGNQKLHDLTLQHGASCKFMRKAEKAPFSAESHAGAERNPTMSQKTTWRDRLAALFGPKAGQGGAADSLPDAETVLDALFSSQEPPAVPNETETKAAAFGAENEALKAQIAALNAQNADLAAKFNGLADGFKSQGRRTEAAAFAEAAYRAARIPAALKGAVAALDAQFAADDEAAKATVTFSVGAEEKSFSRRDALRALIGALPPQAAKFAEVVADEAEDATPFSVLANDKKEAKKSDADVAKELIAKYDPSFSGQANFAALFSAAEKRVAAR